MTCKERPSWPASYRLGTTAVVVRLAPDQLLLAALHGGSEGRKTLELRADGTRTTWSYLYCAGIAGGTASCPTGATHLVEVKALGPDGSTKIGPTATQYYDQLDRVITADTEGFDGSLVRTATVYDAKGRVDKKSRPYFVSGGHVIANMGAELGATTTVFPSDQEVRRFLRAWQREGDWVELVADPGADYDLHDEIDLSSLEPLIAMPSSPGNVKPVREVAGDRIYQAYIGSSANPGFRDFAVSAAMVRGRRVNDRLSFDVSPTSRAQLETLVRDGHIASLIHAGARLHQAGCNGCIGMGQALATNALSLRTVPRNFPGRSGTREDKVCLVSPETATASALTGVITDPRSLGIDYPRIADPDDPIVNRGMFIPPLPHEAALQVAIEKGPNIASLPTFVPLSDTIEGPVLLKVGDDVSTDKIMPAGTRVLPFRSNIPRIADFSFDIIDPTYAARARQAGAHVVVGGSNYGQGSSREHAALGPQFLGLRAAMAKSFARIHAQNLINFGVLPLTFVDPADYIAIQAGDVLRLVGVRVALAEERELLVENITRQRSFQVRHSLSPRQVEFVLSGGLINWMKERLSVSPVSGHA